MDVQGDIKQQKVYAQENLQVLEKVRLIKDAKYIPWSELFARLLVNSFIRFLVLAACLGAVKYVVDNYNSKEGGGLFDMEKFKIEIKTAKDIKQRLTDVKGVDEIKSEVEDLIKMLKNPEKYRIKGAKLHKGVMLYGEPGTGKTLLARAIAGESGVNFIYCTGSDFDEMFVGVGAKRVRELFK